MRTRTVLPGFSMRAPAADGGADVETLTTVAYRQQLGIATASRGALINLPRNNCNRTTSRGVTHG